MVLKWICFMVYIVTNKTKSISKNHFLKINIQSVVWETESKYNFRDYFILILTKSAADANFCCERSEIGSIQNHSQYQKESAPKCLFILNWPIIPWTGSKLNCRKSYFWRMASIDSLRDKGSLFLKKLFLLTLENLIFQFYNEVSAQEWKFSLKVKHW